MTDEVTPTREQCIEWQHARSTRCDEVERATNGEACDAVRDAKYERAILSHLRTPRESGGESDRFRQWFDAVQDLNAAFLEHRDYELAARLYRQCGMRVPNSITSALAASQRESGGGHKKPWRIL